MKIAFITFWFVFLITSVCCAQTKSFEDAQNEVRSFTDSGVFSLYYDQSTYLTVAEIKLDILREKDPLRKQFSKFEWQLTSFFAIKGIDTKPVRNVLCLNSQSKTFQFSRENRLSISFTGDDVEFGEPNRSSELKRGKAKEELCWEVNKEIFTDFAGSGNIKFAIGKFESNVPDDKLNILKDYERLLTVGK